MVGESVFGDFELWKLLEDPDEVFPRVDLPATAALDEGEPDGVGLSGGFAAHEEPVFGSELGGADAVLDEVVVDFQSSVHEADFELQPLAKGVVDGFAEFAFGQDFARRPDFPKGLAEPPVNGKGLGDANPLPLGGACAA